MVAPAASEFEIARGVALAMEPEGLDKRDRGGVLGLDVGLEPVQAELAKGIVEYEAEAFAHKALASEWRADVIAEVSALKGAASDLTELDRAEEGVVPVPTDEEPDKVGAPTPGQISRELGGRPGRGNPGVMEGAAPPVQGEDFPFVCTTGEGEVDPGAIPRGGGSSHPRYLNKLRYS